MSLEFLEHRKWKTEPVTGGIWRKQRFQGNVRNMKVLRTQSLQLFSLMEGGIRKIKALWRGGESLENKGWLLCPCDRASSRPPFASNTAFAHGVHCSNREQSRVPASPRGYKRAQRPDLTCPALF